MEETDALLLDPRTESNEQSDAADQLDGYGLFSGVGTETGTEAELKMLKWYKLANEAALKAALVRNKKAKSLPRFNSTAQRVRERQQCIKQVIVEEHSKPLQVSEEYFKSLVRSEEAEATKIKNFLNTRMDKVHAFIRHHWIREASRQRYLDFCAFMEDELQQYEAEMNNLSAAVHAQESSSHAPNAARTHSPSSTRHYLVSNRAADEALNDTLSSQLQSIALRLEERGGALSHRAATTARIGGAAPAAQRSAVSGLVFFKRKSEARLHQPSQTYYTLKLTRASAGMLGAPDGVTGALPEASGATTLWEDERGGARAGAPYHMKALFDTDPATQLLTAQARGGDDLGLGRPRSSLSARSVTPKLGTSLGAASGRADGAADETSRAQRAVELLEKKQAKEDARRREYAEAQRVDALIKGWLRDRMRKSASREKRLRDALRTDKRFLATLGARGHPLALDLTDGSKAIRRTGGADGGADVSASMAVQLRMSERLRLRMLAEDPLRAPLANRNKVVKCERAARRMVGAGEEEDDEDEERLQRRLQLLNSQQRRAETWKPALAAPAAK